MSFELYFDESNKLDEFRSTFSYYGIIGCSYLDRKKIDSYKNDTDLRKELHFVDFNLSLVNYYLNIFKYALDFIKTNIYIVNNEYAIKTGEKLKLKPTAIRNLLYTKIPERLIYGILRTSYDFKNIDIYIDEWAGYGNKNLEFFSEENAKKFKSIIDSSSKFSDEKKIKECNKIINKTYNHVQLTKTLREQLNAQAMYRGLNYKVDRCRQEKSDDYIGLQIVDIILGIFSFLFEEKYLEVPKNIEINTMNNILGKLKSDERELINSAYKKYEQYKLIVPTDDIKTRNKLKQLNKKLKIYDINNIMKAEFVYLILSDNETLKKLLTLNIFIWPEDDSKDTNSTIGKEYISKYVATFLNFKNDFDNEHMKAIIDFHNDKLSEVKYNFKDYRNIFDYPSRLSKLIERYLNKLTINWLDKDD
ncbi:DUF3800 domain-containing protein [Clostridium tyrobutyricum]|uniref:DUF3800 domain-containing protein n=1 Tax=Clostridium tyrobutyricum TaxID=1519 RepID=UPI001C38B620|nr:DUF3800 domain-containing protein [Clostridium tyrobutyricum]MBV4420593.1 DUF3800 domain-containing protein [Clostridium tyrobutyricum]